MINIKNYGFPGFDNNKNYEGIPARITAVHRERYEIICEHGEGFAKLKTGVYYVQNESFPTVGDFVLLQYENAGDSLIIKTLERKSFFARRDPSPGKGEQAVAANFDTVFVITSLNNDFRIGRLERYLTLAWQSGATPVVILSKADLVEDCTAQLLAVDEIAAGVDIIAISSISGQGLDKLEPYLRPGKTTVLLGSSGVGKSSLLNALANEKLMEIKEIRENDSRGRHTTTHRQLFMLPSGAMIIDTPGMRELGMWNAEEGLSKSFSDVEEILARGCRFSDCRHQTEPGCAIKKAFETGELDSERWQAYLKLQREAQYSQNKETALLNKRRRGKEIAKFQKQLKTEDYRQKPCTESFSCKACGSMILPEGAGSSHRNHCPKCLCSIHSDKKPGDRAALCNGIMDAIGVWVRKNGEWAVIHRCRSCGSLSSNRIAADDNPALLMSIAVKPLALPPFPLNQLEENFND